VTNHLGRPAAHIFVRLYKQGSISSSWQIADWGTSTDNNGQYQFTGLAAGTYRVGFFSDSQSEAIGYYDGVVTMDAATDVSTTAGATTIGVDFQLPVPAPRTIEVESKGSWLKVDQNTGRVTVSQSWSQRHDVTITKAISCTDGATPQNVTLFMGTATYAMQTTGINYSVTIPKADIEQLAAGESKELRVTYSCGGQTVEQKVGKIYIDPSGNVTDDKGNPIAEAIVTLYNVPGWRPKQTVDDNTPNSCQSHLSKEATAPWNQAAPVTQGVMALAQSETFTPAVNPLTTNDGGRYQWDVTEGCWYVTVQADGYETKVSSVVGVPPAVTDLDLALTPLPMLRFTAINFATTANSAVVTVTSGMAVTTTSTVGYEVITEDGTAIKTGMLTFAPGARAATTEQIITIDVSKLAKGSNLNLKLSNATGTPLGLNSEAVLSVTGKDNSTLYLPIIMRK